MTIFRIVCAGSLAVSLGSGLSAQESIQIESSPTYKTLVPLPNSVTGDTQRLLELYRSSDGSIEDMRIIDPSATDLQTAGCARCIFVPGVGCVPVGCGGGTLSTGEQVFLRVAPTGEGSGHSAPLSLEAINVLNGKRAMISVPEMVFDEKGEASLATE